MPKPISKMPSKRLHVVKKHRPLGPTVKKTGKSSGKKC